MRAILTVASNDLLRVFKQRETFLFGLLMPGIMMLLLGVAMGGGEDTATITIDVLDEDSSALSAALVAALRAELELDDSFRLCVLGADDGDGCAVSAAPDHRIDLSHPATGKHVAETPGAFAHRRQAHHRRVAARRSKDTQGRREEAARREGTEAT